LGEEIRRLFKEVVCEDGHSVWGSVEAVAYSSLICEGKKLNPTDVMKLNHKVVR
jgi:hypothetical protein